MSENVSSHTSFNRLTNPAQGYTTRRDASPAKHTGVLDLTQMEWSRPKLFDPSWEIGPKTTFDPDLMFLTKATFLTQLGWPWPKILEPTWTIGTKTSSEPDWNFLTKYVFLPNWGDLNQNYFIQIGRLGQKRPIIISFVSSPRGINIHWVNTLRNMSSSQKLCHNKNYLIQTGRLGPKKYQPQVLCQDKG